ncbi:hypothetical protein [Caldivirga sp.]|uniref:hypothetical protein n=1 Tax=Caldivirga sp. TaxID=2080243 RepID=UPI003D0EB4EC
MYTGAEIKRIFNEVLSSEEALIISPWISGEYASRVLAEYLEKPRSIEAYRLS